MKKYLVGFGLVLLFAVWGGYAYWKAPRDVSDVGVVMISNTGKTLGLISLHETSGGIIFKLNLEGLKPDGEHAIHVHETGDCTPLQTFENAGGHFNPAQHEHGLKNETGPHAGDMPNIGPDENGKSEGQIFNRALTLRFPSPELKRASVFDEDGSAIVIHLDADDQMSQPSGGSGRRIACGVISVPTKASFE